jgi:hypothetical protein
VVADDIDIQVRVLPAQGVRPVRAVRRAWSRRLRAAPAEAVADRPSGAAMPRRDRLPGDWRRHHAERRVGDAALRRRSGGHAGRGEHLGGAAAAQIPGEQPGHHHQRADRHGEQQPQAEQRVTEQQPGKPGKGGGERRWSTYP